MKKLFAILLVLTMAVSVVMLAGCGGETAATKEPETAADAAPTEDAQEEVVDAEPVPEEPSAPAIPETLEVVKEYSIRDDSAADYVVIVKNIGSDPVRITGKAEYKDADGNAVDSDTEKILSLGAGETSFLDFYSSKMPEDGSFSYTLDANPNVDYKPVLADLAETHDFQSGNPVVTEIKLTNNGDLDVSTPRALTIYFGADGTPLKASIAYIKGSDSGIKPGETGSGTDKRFGINAASVEVYLEAHSSKTVKALSNN